MCMRRQLPCGCIHRLTRLRTTRTGTSDFGPNDRRRTSSHFLRVDRTRGDVLSPMEKSSDAGAASRPDAVSDWPVCAAEPVFLEN